MRGDRRLAPADLAIKNIRAILSLPHLLGPHLPPPTRRGPSGRPSIPISHLTSGAAGTPHRRLSPFFAGHHHGSVEKPLGLRYQTWKLRRDELGLVREAGEDRQVLDRGEKPEVGQRSLGIG